MSLTYNPEAHKYFWDNAEVPSVNQILKAEGIIPDFDFPNAEHKRELGTYVSFAIKLWFANELDEDTITGEVKDYFEGFKLFASDFKILPELNWMVEKPLYSEKWKYAGTPDYCEIITNKNILIDWKCTKIAYPMYELTIPAYRLLVEENSDRKVDEAWLVQLSPNKYSIKPMIINKNQWLAILMTYHWKKGRGFYD